MSPIGIASVFRVLWWNVLTHFPLVNTLVFLFLTFLGGRNRWKKQFCHFLTNFRKLLKIVFFDNKFNFSFFFFRGKNFQISNIMKLEGKKPCSHCTNWKHQEILFLTSHSKNEQKIYRPVYMTPSFIKVILDQSSSNIQCKRTMNFMIVFLKTLHFVQHFSFPCDHSSYVVIKFVNFFKP